MTTDERLSQLAEEIDAIKDAIREIQALPFTDANQRELSVLGEVLDGAELEYGRLIESQ